MIRTLWMSVAMFTLAPMQDFLYLGSDSRMNFPGKLGGNWTWRLQPENMSVELKYSIKELNNLYSRMNPALVEKEKKEAALKAELDAVGKEEEGSSTDA